MALFAPPPPVFDVTIHLLLLCMYAWDRPYICQIFVLREHFHDFSVTRFFYTTNFWPTIGQQHFPPQISANHWTATFSDIKFPLPVCYQNFQPYKSLTTFCKHFNPTNFPLLLISILTLLFFLTLYPLLYL